MTAAERFLKYVTFDTQSDEDNEACPSTPGQLVLARFLAEEMKELGLSQVRVDKDGYVYGTLPANCDKQAPVLGLIAHMDTSPDCAGKDIKPRIVLYEGGDVVLNQERGVVLRESEFQPLTQNRGKHLIVTDGTTLLGADDKAGVAEILAALEEIIASGVPHGTVQVGFTPDEEVGRGADRFDVAAFGADYAYTVDGGTLGELEYENFNAASGKVTVNGIGIHPGSAKGKMKNACLMAIEFNALLPEGEIPAETEGYEGFFHLGSMEGDVERVTMSYIIRDHDRQKFEQRKAIFAAAAEQMNAKYGPNTVQAAMRDSYYNMKEQILPHMEIIQRAKDAMEKNGVTPKVEPIRGGTDGARLSFMGLPCPNLSACGENCHGRYEYVPVEDMETMTQVLKTLICDLVE